MDRNMDKLLKWSLQHSSDQPTSTATTTTPHSPPSRPPLDPQALANILCNAPSDAELMKTSLSAIQSKSDIPLASRLVAWDNLEQLLENLDNANNLENLDMWDPLKEELERAEHWEEREYAAWCIGTSVQNNIKSQNALLTHAIIPVLTNLAISDSSPQVRKKAVFALSSAIRNNQKATDEFVVCLKETEKGREHLAAAVGSDNDKIDSSDMEMIDRLMNDIRGRN